MLTFNRSFIAVSATVALTTLLTACGGSSYRDQSSGTSSSNWSSSSSSSSSNNNNNTNNNTGSDDDSSDTNLLPAESYDFTITGATGVQPSFTVEDIHTDRLLKVKITAGPAQTIEINNGSSYFTADYKCVQYTVTLNGNIQKKTKVLAVNGGDPYICPNAPEADTLDFSTYMTQGHGTAEVAVTGAYYDFRCQYCLNYYPMGPMGACPYGQIWSYNSSSGYKCSMTPLYQTHTATGTIQVQVNGTTL